MPKMRHIVLCDGPVKVELEAHGPRAILSVTNSETVRFSVSRANLQAVVDGETIQISHRGIFCKLNRQGDIIRVVFAWKAMHEYSTCKAADFEALVASMGLHPSEGEGRAGSAT
jgi:hypothetical protein